MKKKLTNKSETTITNRGHIIVPIALRHLVDTESFSEFKFVVTNNTLQILQIKKEA